MVVIVSHFTDEELVRHVYASQDVTALERELALRLARALDTIDELEQRLEPDLWRCSK